MKYRLSILIGILFSILTSLAEDVTIQWVKDLNVTEYTVSINSNAGVGVMKRISNNTNQYTFSVLPGYEYTVYMYPWIGNERGPISNILKFNIENTNNFNIIKAPKITLVK